MGEIYHNQIEKILPRGPKHIHTWNHIHNELLAQTPRQNYLKILNLNFH